MKSGYSVGFSYWLVSLPVVVLPPAVVMALVVECLVGAYGGYAFVVSSVVHVFMYGAVSMPMFLLKSPEKAWRTVSAGCHWGAGIGGLLCFSMALAVFSDFQFACLVGVATGMYGAWSGGIAVYVRRGQF
ncbi:hypothetical protein [Rubritalea tangerina]|uniref:hypothetical protein n=1 Tax=Rubritalea tangerina TaxID=430798 RepID=UPI003613655C